MLSLSNVCCISRFCWLLLVSASLLSSPPAGYGSHPQHLCWLLQLCHLPPPASYGCSSGCYQLMAFTIFPPLTFVLDSADLIFSSSCWLRLLSWLLCADGFYHSAILDICAGFCSSAIFPSCWLRLLSWLLCADGFCHSSSLDILLSSSSCCL